MVEQPNEWTKAIKLSEGLSETERVKLSYWTKYREVAQATPEFLKVFNPQKPSKDHWTTLRCGTSAYHIALLIDTQHGRIGIEFYAPDDKEIGAFPPFQRGGLAGLAYPLLLRHVYGYPRFEAGF